MHIWHCIPVFITKVDLEGKGLVSVPKSTRICISANNGMKLKITSVLLLMSIDDHVNLVI